MPPGRLRPAGLAGRHFGLSENRLAHQNPKPSTQLARHAARMLQHAFMTHIRLHVLIIFGEPSGASGSVYLRPACNEINLAVGNGAY